MNKIGNIDIRKAYLGTKSLSYDNAFVGTYHLITKIPPNNEIWYTSTDGEIVVPNNTAYLPTIISNTYKNGKGIIKCNGTITRTSLYDGIFENCTTLQTITFPNSLTILGSDAFRDCANLIDFYIPNSVTEWPTRIFSGCVKLKEINIPNTVTSIGDYAFSDNPALISIIIPDSVTFIDGAILYKTGIQSATLSKNIDSVPEHLFNHCTNLTNIIYNGTMNQWNALSKGYYWNSDMPATVVHCTDGDVAI